MCKLWAASNLDMTADPNDPLYAESTDLTAEFADWTGAYVMFAAIRFRISATPVVTTGVVVKSKRSHSRLCVTTTCLLAVFACRWMAAQCCASNQEFIAFKRSCGLNPGLAYNDWLKQGAPCPARSAGNSNNDYGTAQRAQAAAAAEAQRQRDAELEQQRIEADDKHRMEEVANQAKFIDDRDVAASTLRGSTGTAASGGPGDLGLRGSSATPELRGSTPVGRLKSDDTSVVDLSDTSLADANKALMRHQWAMTIDQRYKDDPDVQQYIRDLWDPTSEHSTENMKHVRSILTEQLKVSGLTQQQIGNLFAALDTFTTGQGPTPKAWNRASRLAHEIDATPAVDEPQRPYQQILVKTLGKTESIKAQAVYMGTGPQTTDDCVLHAIADGAQVPFVRVRAELAPTLKNLAIARIEVRKTPDLAVTSQKNGGTGGLNSFEEIMIANKVGNVMGVPDKNFAKAIESTHSPVIASVVIDDYDSNGKLRTVGYHEVAVTGVYRTVEGKVYYSVMDSNLKSNPNYTAYVEKNDFEDHMAFSGGYVVVPGEKH
jgi:hypothetical protein